MVQSRCPRNRGNPRPAQPSNRAMSTMNATLTIALCLLCLGSQAEASQAVVDSAAKTKPADSGDPPARAIIRVAIIDLKAESRTDDPNSAASAASFKRAIEANRSSLPTELGQLGVKYDVLRPDQGKPALDDYHVLILMPEWTLLLPDLDAYADAFASYVRRGGGLVVFQPNPLCVYPPGAKPPKALAHCEIEQEYCTPKVLPLQATFYNRYVQYEAILNVAGKSHPITCGLSNENMPYTTDRVFDLDRRYKVLARGDSSDSPALAAGVLGRGRIVLIADNVHGTAPARRQAPTAVVARSLLWACGQPDEVVRSISAKSVEMVGVAFSTDPADKDSRDQSSREFTDDPDEGDPLDGESPSTHPADSMTATGKPPHQAPAGLNEGVRSALANTLQHARKGDVIRLQTGVYDVGSLVIPDGVSLVGAGAVNTVLKVRCPKPMGAALELKGNSVVEDLTVISDPTSHGYMVRAAGESARPTMRRCILLPGDNEFCALVAWDKAAPTLSHCVIVSPVGDYGVFARKQAAPVINYCTIVSRGFGIGMMDGSTPVIRRCIVVGKCPGVLLAADCEPALTDCVLFCRGGSPTYAFPITRHASVKDPDAENGVRTQVDPVSEITCRRDILVLDPKLQMGKSLRGFLAPRSNSDAAAYGAYANNAPWPKPKANAPKIKMPNLAEALPPATSPAQR